MKISIAYALPGRQIVQSFEMPEGATIRFAVESSGILEQLPKLDLDTQKIGVFGKIRPVDSVLKAGDRIEIYRPATADPKKVKRRKADAQDPEPS